MTILSNKVTNMQESATLAMARKSRELISKGKDIINLSLGEPDFNTPDFIKEAAKKAIDNNFSKYTPVAGYNDLLNVIVKKFKRDNNLTYEAKQIVCSTGAKQSIAQLLLVLLNSGDEVILPAPYWVSYYQMIQLADGKAKTINTDIENNFKITAKQLEESISNKTKVFLFSSPCNPTGSVYSKEELLELSKVFAKHKDIIIISDEIYEHINFTKSHFSIGSIDKVKDQVVTVNGLSKGYAMTGWRFGYLGAPDKIASACIKMQGQITSATCSITQRAAITALSTPPSKTQYMRTEFIERRNLVLQLLSEINGLNLNKPQGAFYIFPNVKSFIGKSVNGLKIRNSSDLAMFLLTDAGVSVVAGSAFGTENYIRISYAASKEQLISACKLIKISLGKIK
tara:strand:+ start:26473 stop:27666 length:1194 start_codon:yes stop_codon:yes gene_type:complete